MTDEKNTVNGNATGVCLTCGGNNGLHVAGCADAPVAEDRIADRRISENTQMALAVSRISEALRATPMNIALGALATVCGQAHYGFQKDPLKRAQNLQTFGKAIYMAIDMEEEAARRAASPIIQPKTLN